MHRHREDPGEQVLLVVDACGALRADRALEPGAEHEEEEERLRDARR